MASIKHVGKFRVRADFKNLLLFSLYQIVDSSSTMGTCSKTMTSDDDTDKNNVNKFVDAAIVNSLHFIIGSIYLTYQFLLLLYVQLLVM